MIDFSINESGNTGTLTLAGSVTIQHASQLKETLLEGLGAVENFVLDLREVERVDLATIQLLCAAHRRLKKNGKIMVLEGGVPGSFGEIVRESGFVKCAGKGDNSGLWTGDGS